MTWLATNDARDDLGTVLSRRAAMWKGWTEFHDAVWSLVDPVLLELCRLRLAQLLRCEADLHVRFIQARDAGLTEEKIAQLPSWHRAPAFTPAEQACLELAEQCAIEAKAVTDEQVHAVLEHLTDAECFALVHAIGVFEATQRALLLFQVERGTLRYVSSLNRAHPA